MKFVISRLLIFVVAMLGILSCSDVYESDSGSITLKSEGIFVWGVGESTSTTYTQSNIESIYMTDIPTGWEITIDTKTKTITATAPSDISTESGNASGGRATVVGHTPDNVSVPVFLEVGVVERYDLDALGEQSNSMIATQPNKFYTFNPKRIAEQTEETLATKTCKIIWQTYTQPIKFVEIMSDGCVGFYTSYDADDYDEDGSTEDVLEGNAVIGAYNSSGTLLWSWHIWITEDDPRTTTVTLDGQTFMDRNLGASMNDNTDEDYILVSQGLFYQWGRKDPFQRAAYYNADSCYDASMIDDDGDYLYISYVERTSSKGLTSYLTKRPTTYIYTEDEDNRDWLATPDDSLWGNGVEKSIYDPSPKGWMVPASFGNIEVAYNADNEYSATLSDGVNEALFMAVGRRTYEKGLIENVNPVSPTLQAPGGFYWTSTAASPSFVFNTEMVVNSINYPDDYPSVESSLNARANGMQIRCVKVE
ncbi:MAG: hypothetical protein SNH01_00165 [Rikenellaceae bacterium]